MQLQTAKADSEGEMSTSEAQAELFSQYMNGRFSKEKQSTSGVILTEFGVRIINCLRNPSIVDKNFRLMVKKCGFKLMDIPSLGLKEVLVALVKGKQQVRIQLVQFRFLNYCLPVIHSSFH